MILVVTLLLVVTMMFGDVGSRLRLISVAISESISAKQAETQVDNPHAATWSIIERMRNL